MAKPRGRPFSPGSNANPKGRPKGIRETHPRGYLKRAIDTVMAKDPKLIETVLRRSLQGTKKDLQAVELIGRVTKEIGGAESLSAMKPTVIIIKTNVDPLALEGPVARAQRLAREAAEKKARQGDT